MSDAKWTEALEHWSARLGLAGDVQLVCCETMRIPVVVGWRRPRVAVPEALAASASRQAIGAVLLHELAHIARGDYAWNVAWRLVQAVYWPHPLAWLVGRRLNAVREQACDEVCIYWMSDRQAYRATLVELAAGFVRRPLGTLGLAMTRSTKLGRRLAHIDGSEGLPRCMLRRPARWAIAGAVVLAFLAAATLQLVRAPSAVAQQPGDEVAQVVEEKGVAATVEANAAADDEPGDDEKPADGPAPRRVRVANVARQGAAKQAKQRVALEAYQRTEIRARIAGVVKEVGFRVGDVVEAGDVLAELDVPELDEAVEEAQSALVEAKARRQQAAAEVQAAEAALAETQSPLEGILKEIQYAKNTAEFRKKHLELYEKMAVAKMQTSRATIRKAEAEVAVSNAALAVADARLKAAAHRLDVAARNASFRQLRAPLNGRVMYVNAQLGEFVRPEQNRLLFIVARTDLPNKDGRLHSGMYGIATITLEPGDGALVVPKAAVLTEGDETFCFRVANGRAVKTRVTLDHYEGAKALLRDGLADGEAVIVLDGNPPSDGQAVEADE